MRILMTTDCVGGVFVYTLELVRELLARDCQIALAVIGPEPSLEQRAALSILEKQGVEVYERQCALEWMDEPWADVADTSAFLLALARRYAPDCVHLNEFAHGALPWQRPALIVAHSCVLSWWQGVHGEPAPARYFRYRHVVSRALSAVPKVVAPSKAFLRSMLQLYGPLPHACVIPNGIELAAFRPAAKQPRVLCAGRLWDEAKNLALVRESAAALRWPIDVAGPDTAPHGTRRSWAPCQALGTLSREQLARSMASAAIYVSPARYEPFGLSVLEAAAAGCALVLGDIPTLREHWSDVALFVDPRAASELTRALDRLIDDDALRERMMLGAHARSRRFDAKSMADAYLQLYGELCHVHTERNPARCAS